MNPELVPRLFFFFLSLDLGLFRVEGRTAATAARASSTYDRCSGVASALLRSLAGAVLDRGGFFLRIWGNFLVLLRPAPAAVFPPL